MSMVDSIYGTEVLLRCRGTVGTSQINLNPLAQAVRWASAFDTEYQLDVSSSNANDAAAGTGARIITIFGVDKNYNRISEDVTLNGQTKVTSAKKFLRVFALLVKTAGTGLVNAGDLYVVKTGTGGTYTGGVPGTLTSAVLKSLAGDSLAFSGCFAVPAGCTYQAKSIFGSARAQAGTIIVVTGKPSEAAYKGPFTSLKLEVTNGSAFQSASDIVLGPKTDIYVQAISAAAGGIMNATLQIEQISGPGLVQV